MTFALGAIDLRGLTLRLKIFRSLVGAWAEARTIALAAVTVFRSSDEQAIEERFALRAVNLASSICRGAGIDCYIADL